MKRYIVDFRKVNNKLSAHQELKSALELQYYYGENLDALNDCISEFAHEFKIYILSNENRYDYINDILKVFDDNNVNYEIIVEKEHYEENS